MEKGSLNNLTEKKDVKTHLSNLSELIGISRENLQSEVKDDRFTIWSRTTEKREVALSRIFNEILFQMKCFYSDAEIHKMVDQIVVSEVLDDDLSSASAPGSSPGVSFYLDGLSVDSSPGGLHLNGLVEVIPGSGSMAYGTRIIARHSVPHRFCGIDPSFEEIPVTSLLPVGNHCFSHSHCNIAYKDTVPEVHGNLPVSASATPQEVPA
jgi:hypothetical protein